MFASHDEVSQIVASAALSALRVTSTRVVVGAVREEVTNMVNLFRVFFSTLLVATPGASVSVKAFTVNAKIVLWALENPV